MSDKEHIEKLEGFIEKIDMYIGVVNKEHLAYEAISDAFKLIEDREVAIREASPDVPQQPKIKD